MEQELEEAEAINRFRIQSAISTKQSFEIIEKLLITRYDTWLALNQAIIDNNYELCVLLLKQGVTISHCITSELGEYQISPFDRRNYPANLRVSSLFIRYGALCTFETNLKLSHYFPVVNNCFNALLLVKRIPRDLIPILVTFFIE